MRIKYISFLSLLFIIPFETLSAQQAADSTKVLHVLRIEEDFEITGTLSNPVWKRAVVGYIEYEYTPNDDAPAPVKTEVRVLYSDDYVYFGFMAHDPNPSKIRASFSERDQYPGILSMLF